MRKGVFNIKDFFLFVLIYIMIIMHGAVIWCAIIGESYLSLLIVVAIIIVTMAIFDLPLNKFFLLYCSSTAVCYFISAFINGIGLRAGLNIKTALIIDINILLAITIIRLDRNKILTVYVKIVTFIAFISILCFMFQQLMGKDILPAVLFPYVDWGRGHWGYLIYSYAKDTRNFGIFYEPGVYQVLLNSALYILLFWNDLLLFSEKNKRKSIIICLLAIVTAASTTGYISSIILLIGFLIKNNRVNSEERKLWKKVILIGALVFVSCLIDYAINGFNSYFYKHLIKKINETGLIAGNFNYNSSGGARLFIITQAIEALKMNPLFGIGSVNLSNAVAEEFRQGFGTGNALFGIIATKGIVTLILTIIPVFYITYRNKRSTLEFIVLIMMYLNTVVAQAQLLYGSFVLIALYSPKYNKNVIEKKYCNLIRGG